MGRMTWDLLGECLAFFLVRYSQSLWSTGQSNETGEDDYRQHVRDHLDELNRNFLIAENFSSLKLDRESFGKSEEETCE